MLQSSYSRAELIPECRHLPQVKHYIVIRFDNQFSKGAAIFSRNPPSTAKTAVSLQLPIQHHSGYQMNVQVSLLEVVQGLVSVVVVFIDEASLDYISVELTFIVNTPLQTRLCNGTKREDQFGLVYTLQVATQQLWIGPRLPYHSSLVSILNVSSFRLLSSG